MPTGAKSASRDKVRAHRARMRKKGMATSPHAKEDQDFVNAVSVWTFE